MLKPRTCDVFLNLVTAEHANNPLGFKFSWSPRGALLSQLNSAQFLSEGKTVEISNKHLMGVAEPYFVLDGYDFVTYPNRNSVPFRDFYNIPEADIVIRGSLRYQGNPAFVKALTDLGWLDTQTKDWLKPGLTWAEVTHKAIGSRDSSERYVCHVCCLTRLVEGDTNDLLSSLIAQVKELCRFPNKSESDRIINGLRWIGLFSSEQATVRSGNLLDTVCAQLEKELSYRPGERDLVILQHKFVIEWDGGKRVRMLLCQIPIQFN